MSADPFYQAPHDAFYADSNSPFLHPQSHRAIDEFPLLPFSQAKRRSGSTLSSFSSNYPSSPPSPTAPLGLAIEPTLEQSNNSYPLDGNVESNSSVFPTLDFDSIAEMAKQLMTSPLDSGVSSTPSCSPNTSNGTSDPRSQNLSANQSTSLSSLQKLNISGLTAENEPSTVGAPLKKIMCGPTPPSSAESHRSPSQSQSPDDVYDSNHHFDNHAYSYSNNTNNTKPKSKSNIHVDDRPRSRLTRDQMSALKRVYSLTYFPDKATKEQLAQELNIPVRTIQIWFQNQRQYHRIKLKKRASQHQIQKPNARDSLAQHSHVAHAAHKQASAAAVHQQAMMSAVLAGASGAEFSAGGAQLMNSRRNSAPPNYFHLQDQEAALSNQTMHLPSGYQPLRRASMMASTMSVPNPHMPSPGPSGHPAMMPTVPEHSGLVLPPASQYSNQYGDSSQHQYNEMPLNMLLNMAPSQAGQEMTHPASSSTSDWSQQSFPVNSFSSHQNQAYPAANSSPGYDFQQPSPQSSNSPWMNASSRSRTYSNMLF